ADVAFQQLDVLGEVGDVLALAGREVVDDADAIAARDQRPRDRRPDEPRPTRDQVQTHRARPPSGVDAAETSFGGRARRCTAAAPDPARPGRATAAEGEARPP